MPGVRSSRITFRGEETRTVWLVAIAGSIALHALLLAWPQWPSLREGGAAAPIGARLSVPPDAPAHDVAGPAPTRGADGAAGPAAAPMIESPGGTDAAKRSPTRAAEAAAPASAAADRVAPQPHGIVAATPRAAPAPAGDPASAAAASDVATVAQYRIVLMSAARRHARYPEAVVAQGLEGRVDVRVAIGADGALERAEIARSSGHLVLDDLALEIVRNAQPGAPVPPALLARPFAVEVPVVFSREAR